MNITTFGNKNHQTEITFKGPDMKDLKVMHDGQVVTDPQEQARLINDVVAGLPELSLMEAVGPGLKAAVERFNASTTGQRVMAKLDHIEDAVKSVVAEVDTLTAEQRAQALSTHEQRLLQLQQVVDVVHSYAMLPDVEARPPAEHSNAFRLCARQLLEGAGNMDSLRPVIVTTYGEEGAEDDEEGRSEPVTPTQELQWVDVDAAAPDSLLLRQEWSDVSLDDLCGVRTEL